MKVLFLDDYYPELSTFRILEGDLIFKYFPESKHVRAIDDPIFESETFDLGYTIGYGHCLNRLANFEKYQIPFCFENYPGFGFSLDSTIVRGHLERIFSSEMFRGVIT